jgi:hypothetical protein
VSKIISRFKQKVTGDGKYFDMVLIVGLDQKLGSTGAQNI